MDELPEELIPRFLIGTPGNPQPLMLESVMRLLKPPGTEYLNAAMGRPGLQKLNISEARNYIIEEFLTAHEKPGGPPRP